PQQPLQGKDLETSSLIEYPSFKKRRICENFAPNPGIPVALKEVASGGFKARQCVRKWKEFADNSKKRSGELDCKGFVGSLSVGNEGVPRLASL
ncbi:hypothetical protein QQP08_020149, partial [Theobroma cacao]